MNALKLIGIFLVGAILVVLFTYGAMKVVNDITHTIEMGIGNLSQSAE